MDQNSSSATKISTYLMIIILIVLALSIVALILAISVYPSRPDMAVYLLIIGFVAMGLSCCRFLLFTSIIRLASRSQKRSMQANMKR